MASKSKIQTLMTQPPFAQQIQTVPTPLGVQIPLQRGFVIWDKPMTGSYGSKGGPAGDGRDMIKFLFNPSTVSTDYNVANASLQAAMMYQVPGDQGNLLAPMLYQTVSFDLYYDRLYELNYGGNSSAANDPAILGCQADVLQFMQFTGLLASLSKQQSNQLSSAASGAGYGSSNASYSTSGGIMMMVPCWLYFGSAMSQLNQNPKSANFNAVKTGMNYYGYISEWGVQYTHWTAAMIPIRCSISVSFTMLPNPVASNESAVWRDLSKLGKGPSTVPNPYPTPTGNAPTPPIGVLGG